MEATKALAQKFGLRRRGTRWMEKKWGTSKLKTRGTPADVNAHNDGAESPFATKAVPETQTVSVPKATTIVTTPTKAAPTTEVDAQCEQVTAAIPPRIEAAPPSQQPDLRPKSVAPPPSLPWTKQTGCNRHMRRGSGERVIEAVPHTDKSPRSATPGTPIDNTSAEDGQARRISFAKPTKVAAKDGNSLAPDDQSDEAALSTLTDSPSTAISPRESQYDYDEDAGRASTLSGASGNGSGSLHSSMNSVAFQLPNTSLPQGRWKPQTNSPPPSSRFRKHVTFNNVQIGEPTKNNFPSYTLVVRHLGYYSKRRSRTFMVGIDDHQYSDEALQWLFDKFVEDGDEIVCVRVIEKDVRQLENDRRVADFQHEANAEVEKIKAKSGDNKAISIVLEYAVGKLHSTFQRLIQLHQPSMLIVGTRGRTLGGFQGLMASRNSFSKYCLQYCPVPVVVVRPDEKRQKKKDRRDADPEKQSYRQMLQFSQGIHEADSDTVNAWEFESKLTADEEAGKVAKALGLPAKFDPTMKPLKKVERPRSSLHQMNQATITEEPGRLISTPAMTPTASAANSEDEGSGEEDEEGEFEVTSGARLLKAQRKELEEKQKEQERKDRLHKMEVGEAKALLKHKEEAEDEDDEDDEDDGGGAV